MIESRFITLTAACSSSPKRGLAKCCLGAEVACLSSYVTSAVAVDAWYDEAPESKRIFDTVLVLANERDVRSIVSARNDPIQLQATTGQSWLSQLHRHISGRDDCVRCRTADIRTPQLACSAASTATDEQPERPDAALPFLSAASGLMLVSALQHLQHGHIGKDHRTFGIGIFVIHVAWLERPTARAATIAQRS